VGVAQSAMRPLRPRSAEDAKCRYRADGAGFGRFPTARPAAQAREREPLAHPPPSRCRSTWPSVGTAAPRHAEPAPSCSTPRSVGSPECPRCRKTSRLVTLLLQGNINKPGNDRHGDRVAKLPHSQLRHGPNATVDRIPRSFWVLIMKILPHCEREMGLPQIASAPHGHGRGQIAAYRDRRSDR
jgi:hypothetical protein